ncbi:MAG TPA: class I SAM-dependent methyltransferase [Actinomycetota bacterium]|nr:class I SAM-dependent methyltransferase [Actinomycetota bacterium]
MTDSRRDYEQVYSELTWAYGDKPDLELIHALEGRPRGRAVDVGGGQGRHALPLAALGFDVVVVDTAAAGLHQGAESAAEKDLNIHFVQQDAAQFEYGPGLKAAVAALFFHIPAHKTSISIAQRIGEALEPGSPLYLSVPGFTSETVELVEAVIEAAGCKKDFIVKHLVTKKERPRLSVPRRNETRALGIKP